MTDFMDDEALKRESARLIDEEVSFRAALDQVVRSFPAMSATMKLIEFAAMAGAMSVMAEGEPQGRSPEMLVVMVNRAYDRGRLELLLRMPSTGGRA